MENLAESIVNSGVPEVNTNANLSPKQKISNFHANNIESANLNINGENEVVKKKRHRIRASKKKTPKNTSETNTDNEFSILNTVKQSNRSKNSASTNHINKQIDAHNHDILNLQNLFLKVNGLTLKDKSNDSRRMNHRELTSKDNQSQHSNNHYSPRNKLHKNNEYSKYDAYASYEEIFIGLQTGIMIESTLRINAKCYQQAYVSHPDKNKSDILINGVKDRNRALDDDLVIVEILNPDDTVNKPIGKVVCIKERRNKQTCVGFLKLDTKNSKEAIFTPRDKRYPIMYIPIIDCPPCFQFDHKVYEKTMFFAKIINWCNPKYIIGTLLSNIGHTDDMKAQAKSILIENDLDTTPYSYQFKDLYPNIDFTISEDQINIREDFRNTCVFTIDPLTARDLDDAVSCKLLANGNYEIGVHISDVTYYLKQDMSLNEEVAKKATTVYLVDGTYHMLPKDLCFCCSLLPGCDKLTFSVIWEMSKDGTILNHRFSRSIINSCCQLAYDHVQYMIENPDKPLMDTDFPTIEAPWNLNDIKTIVLKLFEFSTILRKRRFESGALRIDQPKLHFRLDPVTGFPLSFEVEEHNESHSLIEEFMLLANCTVAKRIHEDFPQIAFLRMHPPPKNTLEVVKDNFKRIGIELDISSAGQLQASLAKFIGEDISSKSKMIVVHTHLVKTLSRALYFCANGYDDDEIRHYALNIPLYTHFTSPIRRYADIMVHRLLSSSLGYSPMPTWKPDYVQKTANHCNTQKYNAKKAGEMSAEVYLNKYIVLNSPILVTAAVLEVFENSLDVVIFSTGTVKRIYYDNFSEDKVHVSLVKNENESGGGNKALVTWETPSQVTQILQIFDIVQVTLKKTDNLNMINARIVRPNLS